MNQALTDVNGCSTVQSVRSLSASTGGRWLAYWLGSFSVVFRKLAVRVAVEVLVGVPGILIR